MVRGKSEGKQKSIAIGPANYAGQATAWANACRLHLGLDAQSFGRGPTTGSFGYRVDRVVGRGGSMAPLTMGPVLKSLSEYEIVAIDGFASLTGLPRLANFERQVEKLERNGKSVILISHGTDTRDPLRHMRRVSFSYFKDSPRRYVDSCVRLSEKNRNFVQSGDRKLFVSTPDLTLDNPSSQWLPLCVDISRWLGRTPALADLKPRVLHVPSRRTPPIKGTQYIEPVLSKLHRAGIIEAIMPEFVRHDEMPALVGSVDIVVDQIQTGSYGVAAVEAMAAGRLVIGNVSTSVRELLPCDLPIIDVTPDSLEQDLRKVAADRAKYQELSAAGTDFVRRIHDGRLSAEVLSGALC